MVYRAYFLLFWKNFKNERNSIMATQCSNVRKAYRQGELLFVPVGQEELKSLEFDPGNSRYSAWNKLASKADLAGAAISYCDESGRYADFHALRHTTGSLLAAGGIHPKVAQAIMRHSDINLTMSRYTHSYRESEVQAVKSLPDLSLPSIEAQEAKATGTDGQKNSAIYLAKPCGKQRILANVGEQITGETALGQNAANSPITLKKRVFDEKNNGGGGIRTPVTIAGKTVFKTVAISRSATPPAFIYNTLR